MLRLFKRTRIESWELEMMNCIFNSLPETYDIYLEQINEGFINGVKINFSDIPNFVGFTHNATLFKRFYVPIENNFKLTNIELINKENNIVTNVSIYFAFGVITGYSLSEKIKIKRFSFYDVNVSKIHKTLIGVNNYDSISYLLTRKEKEVINASEVYITTLAGKDYYHLKELEDGDFVAIDKENKIYHITHDPFEITLLERNDLVNIITID